MTQLCITLILVLNALVVLVSGEYALAAALMQVVSFALVAAWRKLNWKQILIMLPLYGVGFYFFTMMTGFIFGPVALILTYNFGVERPDLFQLYGATIAYAFFISTLLRCFAWELGLEPAKESA